MTATGTEAHSGYAGQGCGAAPWPDGLRDFISRGADPYLQHFARLRRNGLADDEMDPDRRLPFAPSWLWPAFALTVPWLFYRKMYTGGIILVAMPVLLDHLLPGSLFLGSGILIAATAGLCGKSWYLDHAANRMAKARRLYQTDAARRAYLVRAGGVSLAAGTFGALIQIVIATVVVLDLLPPTHF